MSERLTCPVCGRQLEKKDLISVLMTRASPSVVERMAAVSADIAMCSDCHILVLDEEQAKSLERFKPSEKNTLKNMKTSPVRKNIRGLFNEQLLRTNFQVYRSVENNS